MSNILTNNINARSGNTITIGKAGDTVSIAGTISYEDVSSVDSVGVITARNGIHALGSGNLVGIGTTNPESRLHVSGTHNSHIRMTNTSSDAIDLIADANRSGSDQTIFSVKGRWDGTDVSRIVFRSGSDTTDKDDGYILFQTRDSGSSIAERLRITSDGRVRIGSFGAPSNKNSVTPLSHVDGSGVNGGFQVNRHTSVGGGGAQLLLSATRGSSITGHTILQDDDGIGTVDFLGSDGDEFVPAASIQAQVDGTPGNNDMPGRLTFKTTADGASQPTEHMRITAAGDVQVKEYSPRIGAAFSAGSANFTSYFAATGSGTGNIPVIIERYSDDGIAIEFKRNTSVVGNINVTSTTTNYVESSDYRLKENVVDLDDAITRVKQLAPKRFNFIADADTTVDGFLAHEAATVVPEAVTGTHNEVDDENNPVYQGIDKSKLVPLLTAALQEAITKIETLETKVAALEGN